MKLNELKSLLKTEAGKHFRLQLPNGDPVPVSFHVTEVGHIRKTFIDCGGVIRDHETCQLQVWVGGDVDHRIEAEKAVAILDKAAAFFTNEAIPVEVEYEDEVISQYGISGHESDRDSVTLRLAHKHTDCLAREQCLSAAVKAAEPEEAACCGTTGCG